MNKIFRIVWSQATQSWVVVSELTKAHKKQSSSNAQRSSVKFSGRFIKYSAVALALLSGHSAYAAINVAGTGHDNAVAFGPDSNASKDGAVALGKQAKATGNEAAALGKGAKAEGNLSVAVGPMSQATADSAMAFGVESKALGEKAVALGRKAEATKESAVALGFNSKATGLKAVALGEDANAVEARSIAIGNAAKIVNGQDTITIGSNTQVMGEGSISIGKNAKSTAASTGTVVIGKDAFSEGSGNAARPNTVVGAGAYTAVGENGTYRLNAGTALGFQAGSGLRVDSNANNKLVDNNTNADSNENVLVKAGYGLEDLKDAAKKAEMDKTKAFLQAGFASNGLDTNGFSGNSTDIAKSLSFYRQKHINEATAIGVEARAIGDQSIAIGGQVVAGDGVVALGGNDTDVLRGNKYQVVTDDAVNKAKVGDIDDYNLAYTESTTNVAGQFKKLVGRDMTSGYRSTYGQSGSVAIGMQAHSTTALGTAIGTNSVVRMGAFGATAIGAGSTVQPNAEAAVAIGMGSVANGAYALAGGTASWAEYGDIALGYQAKASGKDGAIAMGRATNAQGDSSIMIGGANIASASKQTTTFEKAKPGEITKKTVTEKINGQNVNREYTFAATDKTNGTVAEAYKELTAHDMDTKELNFADKQYKNGHASTSLGVHALSRGDLGTAIGASSRADAIGSVALGVGAHATKQNAVAIGTGSTTDLVGTRQLSVNYDSDGNIVSDNSKDIAYTFKWAGGTNTAEGDVVSFGSSGAERQLKNVAAGRVAEDSTDAINGSQLNSITKKIAAGFNTSGNEVAGSSGVFTSKKANADSAKKDYETAIRSDDKVQLQVGNNLKLDRNETESEVEVPDDFDKNKTVKKKIRKADFAYSLNPVLTNLTSATFKNDAGDTTVINGAGVTVTPVTKGKQPVSLTTTGLNNGGNAISNVAGNLPETKNNDAATGPSNATTSQAAPTLGNAANQVNPTNAATVSDVLNAGWNVQGNGTPVDFVKAYDTVNFINGDGTIATVESADGKTSTVKYSVNLGNGLEKDANNNINVKAADTSLVVDRNGVKVNTGAINNVITGDKAGTVEAKNGDENKVATVGNVVNAINNAAWTATSAKTGAGELGKEATNQLVKAGDKVTFEADKNIKITQDAGKFTFATKENVTFNTVQVGGDQGPKLSKSDAGDLKVSGPNGTDPVKVTNVKDGDISADSKDAINGSQFHKLANNTIQLKGQTGDNAATETNKQALNKENGIAFTVKSSDGTLLEVTAADDTITLTPKTATLATKDGVPTASTTGGKLVTADQLISALTEMGWKATADKDGSGTVSGAATELIKAGNTVTFKAGDNLAVKQDGKNFIYSLQKELTGLTSAEFKNQAGDKTVINSDGVTITPATNGKQPVSLTNNGLNNGGNPITNVTSNLVNYVEPEVNGVQPAKNSLRNLNDNSVANTNAATVGDLRNMGWIVSSDKKTDDLTKAYSETVKNANEVKFVGEGGVTVSGKTENGVRTITVKAEAQEMPEQPVSYTTADGTKVYPKTVTKPNGSKETKYYPNPDGTGTEIPKENVIASINGPKGTKAPTTLSNVAGNLDGAKEGTKAPTTEHDPVNTTDAKGPNYVNPNNAATVGDVLNAGWNLQNNGTAKDFVKPYDTVNFVDGINTKAVVTTDAEGKVSNVQIDVKDLPIAYTNEAGDKVVKAADGKYYKESDLAGKVYDPKTKQFKNADGKVLDEQPKEVAGNDVKTNLVNPNAEANKAGDATQLGNVASGANTFAPVEDKKLGNDGKWYNAADVLPNGQPKENVQPVAKPDNVGKAGLIDFSKSNPNNAATVGDLQNLGWVVSAEGNDYSDQVRNANEVKFVGEGTATVTGETDKNGVRTITVSVDDQVSTNNAITPVNYTTADGTKVYPLEDENGNVTYHTTPDGTGDGDKVIEPENVITSLNGPKGTKEPTTLSNVAGNLDGAKKDTKAPTTEHGPVNTTDAKGPNYVNPNNAATVGDVLNAGWNLQNNGTAKDFVKPYDTVNFVDGINTKAVVTTDAEGKVSNVQIDVKDLPIAYTNEAGDKVVKAADGKYYKESDLAGKVYDPKTKQFKNADGKVLDEQPKEVAGNDVKTNLVNPNAEANKAGDATQLGNVASGANTFAPVEDKKLGNDGKWYNAADVLPNGQPKENVQPVAKPDNVGKAGLIDFSKSNPNNAATVGDLQNMGWIVGAPANGYTDQVRNTNKVNFVGKGIATVTGETDENGVRTITVNVSNGLVDVAKNKVGTPTGAVTGPKKAAEDALNAAKAKLDELNNKPTATDEEKKAAQDAVNKAQSAVNNAPSLIATAENVADMINKSGFTLKADKTEGDNLTAADLAKGEMINPGDTITMKAGKNMSVKHEKDGSITYATKDDVEFNTVKVGNPNNYVDNNGKPLVKVGDNYYKPEQLENGKPIKDAMPVDPATVKNQVAPVNMKTEAATPATNNTGKDKDGKTVEPTTALNISSDDGKPTQLKGVGSVLNTADVNTSTGDQRDTDGNVTTPAKEAKDKLVNLGTNPKKDDKPLSEETLNSAATVRDLANMGWVVSAKDNNYTNTVKNANKVEFKGDNGISVTGKDVTQADGTVTREITVAIADGKVTDKVTITKDGKDIPAIKIGDNYYEVDKNGKPVGYEVDEKGKPTANNKPIDVAGATITNEGNKVVTGNTVATAIQESGWNVGLADSSKANAAFSDKDKALSADKLEKVNPNDNVRFADGKGTKAAVATVERVDEFGKKVTDTYVKFDVDAGEITADTTKPGAVKGPVTADEAKKLADDLKKAEQAVKDLPADATPETKKAAQDALKLAQDAAAPLNKVATAQNVAEAINNSGWRTNSTTATGGAKDTLINPGKAVNFEAGKNMEVAQTVDKDGNVAYTYKTKDNVQFNSVQFGGDTGPKISNNDGNINVSGPDGKAPTKITGVAAGDISPNSTDAVNGAQIYALVGDQSNVNQTSPTYTKVDLDENGKPSYTTVNAPAGKTVVTAKDDNGHDVPVLKTYNVHSQKEIVTNSVVEAIHNMNEQGIKFFHSNDGVERPKQEQTNSFDSSASGKFATAIGSRSKADGTNAVAIGFNSVVTGNDSISIGTGNRVTGNNSGAFGDPSTVSGQGSYSVGNNNTVATNDTFVLGNEVKHTVENSAILGAKSTARGGNGSKTGTLRNLKQDGTQGASTTAGSTGTVSTATVGHMTYGGFQGDKADGVVSVGAAGNERRIQNVAAGEISKTSTDAINGSQLYAVAAGIGHKLGDLDNKINKVGKRGDAGTASALAAANIPQAYTPGKSLVGIAAGSYQGQNGLAVGMSRISDNGKIIIRLSGTANSQGKTGVAAGVGYQW